MCFRKSGSIRYKIPFTFFLSVRGLKESEDHSCAVYTYTKTYASDAIRLYGGCVRNFYSPLRRTAISTFVPLYPLVVSPLFVRSGWAGCVRGARLDMVRKGKVLSSAGNGNMSPPLDTLTLPPREGLGPAEKNLDSLARADRLIIFTLNR